MEGRAVLKKGPWTAVEDETLAAYVREYGERNWNAVQKKTWLARCGKSCRLRWANHLRPNLRKGSFSAHEERLIIHLHSQLGNKWARMAAQLPGRTDNEIKNYWNTRLKRFQRQGLPLYPPDISPNNPSSSPTPASSKRSYNTAFAHTHFPPSYDTRNNTDLHITTCQLLEDLMDEALGCWDPKRTKLMPAPHHHDTNFVSAALTHFASSNNLSPQQDLKPKEQEPLQINTMQYDDIAKLLDWESQIEEISNRQSSVDSLVLDARQLALLFPIDQDNNTNTNTNPTYTWDNLPGFC